MQKAKALSRADPEAGSLEGLYADPIFLVRRANQIATAVFAETCSKLEVTPAQYYVLFVLRRRSPISHNELGRCACLDPSTTNLVVRILRERRMIYSQPHGSDRRKVLLTLTGSGRTVLEQADRLCSCAGRELLSVYGKAQAGSFVESLQRLTSYHEARRNEGAARMMPRPRG
jgi:DNA-binding MarR family transcriptional regulator